MCHFVVYSKVVEGSKTITTIFYFSICEDWNEDIS
jgi:hypothetical protein